MGEGRGTAGILPVRKCPPLGSSLGNGTHGLGAVGGTGNRTTPAGCLHVGEAAAPPSPALPPVPRGWLPLPRVRLPQAWAVHCKPHRCNRRAGVAWTVLVLNVPRARRVSLWIASISTSFLLKFAFCLTEELYFRRNITPCPNTHTYSQTSVLLKTTLSKSVQGYFFAFVRSSPIKNPWMTYSWSSIT